MKIVKFKLTIIFMSIFAIFSTCKNDNKITYQPRISNNNAFKDTLVKANQFLIQKDNERIDSYIARKNWNMQTTKTGLRYEIYSETSEKNLKQGDIVVINYKIELLDGTVCYTSDSTGQKTVKIGKSGEVSGLDEALLLMRTGEKGRFILPPYLALGLIGDLKKIPARSTIIYHIEVTQKIDF